VTSTASHHLPRLLEGLHRDGRALSLREHLAYHGPLPPAGRHSPDTALTDLVERSGLRGRGGANFPSARKLASVAAGRGRRVVVANGAEGEPGSAKDKVLLGQAPHLVLDGAAMAAQAVGAAQVIVAALAPSVPALLSAVSERDAQRIDRVRPVVVTVPDRFIAGEESALVNYLNQGPGLPTFVPPRPYERGVGGRPTLVQNVETLSHMALIARHGPDWFRAIGPPEEPGSTLVTVQGALRHPGVYEVARGMRLSELVRHTGGPTAPIQAFLIGGYAGAWLPADAAWDTPLSDAALREQGGTLGAGVVLAFPAGACGVAETARIMTYLAEESAGQCGPCVHGLAAMARATDELARGTARRDVVERLQNWAWQVAGRGACHHPDGAVRMVASALRTFSTDVSAHRQRHVCPGAKGPQTSAARTPAASGRARR
jgi:NADH:ubiquinone oxidoreductase subunit F (NADH-binding)